jgi:NADH-quinone oxidoreductase subunit C
MDIRTPVPTIYGHFHEKYGPTWVEHTNALKESFGDAIEAILMPVESPVDMPTIFVKKDKAHELLSELKNKYSYSFLTDMTATDELEDEESEKEGIRFHLVFHLMNIESKIRIRIKIKLKDAEKIPTFIEIWPGTNWAEREIFDMFGVHFESHPDLRRILMDMRWEGHPLRKDYPLRGYQIFLTPEPLDPELLK